MLSLGTEEAEPSLHIVRLLTFQPGILFCEIPYTAEVLHQVGKYVGAINHALHVSNTHNLSSFFLFWTIRINTILLNLSFM